MTRVFYPNGPPGPPRRQRHPGILYTDAGPPGRMQRNADPGLRARERRCKETDDPEDCLAWLRARQRAGDMPPPTEWWPYRQASADRRDAFAAVLEERAWHRREHQEELRADLQQRQREIDQAEMAALRRIHPRVRRSKRRNVDSLREWAERVALQEGIFTPGGVGGTSEPFFEERRDLRQHTEQVANAFRRRTEELKEMRDAVAWEAESRPGPNELEFRFHRTSTYQTTGYGADHYAKLGAEGDVGFLRNQGFEARMEKEEGEPWGPGGPPRTPGIRGAGAYAWIRPGQGWRSVVLVDGPLDVEILRARQEAWKERDWDDYYAKILSAESKRDVRSHEVAEGRRPRR